ncbi:MAG: FixH family protein [Sulfurimonas sp.]|nr:FixH family protein [Sulfurimonas sp.]
MNLIKSGKIWPYAIGISIIFIFSACVATIIISTKLPVEKSDNYMMGYHEVDAKVNDIIEARISFNKKYKIEYIADLFSQENSTVKYKIIDTNGNVVNNANIKIIITRPNNHKYNQEFINPIVDSGIYSFKNIILPKEGRWNIMAKINIEKEQNFLNVKVDTRNKEVYEY